MDDAYYRWLLHFLGDEYLEMNYQKLLYKLYTTDFYWELEYDGNRAADGVYLRTLFMDEKGADCGVKKIVENAPCSVLEMLIALAKKTEHDIMYNPYYGDRTCKWFWVMLENLGLDAYDDYGYFEDSVDRILYIFMHHLYAPNGNAGGMFPNNSVEVDLRKTDIWWQLNSFLEKNYPI